MPTAPSKPKKKRLIVILGPAGSGKSMFAKQLAAVIPSCVVQNDVGRVFAASSARRAFKGRRVWGENRWTDGADTVIQTTTEKDVLNLKLPNLHTVIEMHSCKGPILP